MISKKLADNVVSIQPAFLCAILRIGLADTFPAFSRSRHRKRQVIFVDPEPLRGTSVNCYSN